MTSLQSLEHSQPPEADELELVIFGPGVGECIILHLGNGDWIVVDSCVAPVNGAPVALEYLRGIGVDPASSVRSIVATHWHDDHIQGIAATLLECSCAEFVMSGALAGQQFFQMVLEVDSQNRLVKHTSSASEFSDVFEILQSRSAMKYVAGPHLYAQDGVRLFRGGHASASEVWALSPSAATITNALTGLADRLLTDGASRRFKRFSPNDLSVAILVKTPTCSLLLGADLENSASEHFGWKAVLRSSSRPDRKANAFKVAHHGSQNADHEDVWKDLLIGDATAVVTPFAKLSNPLPTDRDVQRLKSRTSKAYCTTWPISKKPPKRRAVDGIVSGATKSRRAVNYSSGYIRVRLDLSDSSAVPSVQLFGSAKQL